jgi:hypothetical protein
MDIGRMHVMKDLYIAELDGILAEYRSAERRNLTVASALSTRCITAIDRAGGRSSIYFDRASSILAKSTENPFARIDQLMGIATALRHDLANGYLVSYEERIHGEIFSDYLEMAQHICDTGYKDAAAVIAGSTLESHLRQMCQKAGVPIEADGKPKKADTMNADLYKATAYTSMQHKSITAWLGLRNNAAHGKYNEYAKPEVALFIAGIREFMTRHPA